MCIKCNPNNVGHEQLMGAVHMRIATNGYTLQGVLPDERNVGWTYTIGLSESFDVPELVIVHDNNQLAVEILEDVIDDLLDGNHIDDIPRSEFVPVDVHQSQLQGDLLNVWRAHYEQEPSTVRVVQLKFGPSYLCSCCEKREQVDLSNPDATTRRPGMNRAQRRARRRRAS